MNIKNISNVVIDNVEHGNPRRVGEKNIDQNISSDEQPKELELSKADIMNAVDKLNDTTKVLNERISFSYHEKTNRIIVKVIDSDTNEVVREIPPKDIIRLLEHLQEYIGMFVDESR